MGVEDIPLEGRFETIQLEKYGTTPKVPSHCGCLSEGRERYSLASEKATNAGAPVDPITCPLRIDFRATVDNNVHMRVIKRSRLEKFCSVYPQARKPLLKWYALVRKACWGTFAEMRRTFPSADEVRVNSGRSAVVFNVKGNDYRLITAVHYRKSVKDREGDDKVIDGKIFVFFLLTHAEYDKDFWKAQL